MANTGLGVTIGSHSLRAVKLRRKGEGFVVQRVFADRLNDETRAVAGRALAARGLGGAPATVGLSGRDVIIRYSQVPPVPEWRLRNLMKYEVEEVSSQSGGDVSADYQKLNLPDPEGERTDDTILVALARNAYLDRIFGALRTGGIRVGGGCPNSVALYNAFAINATYTEDETTLLVNVGATNLDIAIQRDGQLLFARNATPAGQAFTEAIQTAFSTTAGKAEQMKVARADVTPKGQARYPDPTAEKVANAIVGVAGQMASLIQSTLMIARAQTKIPDLKVDRVMLAGGGASLKGLDRYLHQAMGVPVERLDPFALSDLSGLGPEDRQMVQKAPHEFAVAVGLAQARLAEGAFPLEVLPQALRRQRDLATKGVFALLAAAAAVGVLLLVHHGRSRDAKKARGAVSRLRSLVAQANASDDKFRGALQQAQEAEVKHLLLAEVTAPGSLLARTLKVLEENLAGTKEVWLEKVELRTSQQDNEIRYWSAGRELASGYTEVPRRVGYPRLEAEVYVKAMISAGAGASRIHTDFLDRCQANDQGLVVLVPSTLTGRGSRSGTDLSFELVFRAGEEITLRRGSGAAASRITLTGAVLYGDREPEGVTGRRVDGRRVRIPKDEIDGTAWRELVDRLPRESGEEG